MSSTASSAGLGSLPTSDGSGVRWVRAGEPEHIAPLMPPANPRRERIDAMLLAALTLANGSLAIYDLALLAAGAH